MTEAVLYARTSTEEQENGMDSQRERLVSEAERRGWAYRVEPERASGKTLARRPVLRAALDRLDRLGSDGALVVTKIDRLARSVPDFAAILQRSQRKGWAIVVLDIGAGRELDTTDPFGMFGAWVWMAAAQLERDLIAMRTREGLAVVKARGVKLGKPSTVPEPTRRAIAELRDRGLSWRLVADELNGRGVPAPRGDRWHPTSVRRHCEPKGTEMQKRDMYGKVYQASHVQLSCGCGSGKQSPIVGEATVCLNGHGVVTVVSFTDHEEER